MSDYQDFIDKKSQLGGQFGFEPTFLPDFLFDFQRHLVEWAVQKGRAAIFADCGLGKTPMQLVWAQNVVEKTNRPVLILTPLAVAGQTVREADKFGLDAVRSTDGSYSSAARIVVANYERLQHFNPDDFAGVVCDESSILKNFSGRRRSEITRFMRKHPYRLLCTATAAPNDYIELGTSSEALGELGHMDMLSRFFKNTTNEMSSRQNTRGIFNRHSKWRFKRHAEKIFWRWVCSWSRSARRPSDLGFDDGDFRLPELIVNETVVPVEVPRDGMLFAMPAEGLHEQREERKLTIQERCEAAAEKVDGDRPAVVWCHLNAEGDLLEKIIPGAWQVKGSQTDNVKESILESFSSGEARVLITKPRIGAFGLNWQHCDRMTFFPSHSFEQYYQGVRRCWRFGQKNPVTVDIVTTEGERDIMSNLQRKSEAASEMFSAVVREMGNALTIKRTKHETTETEVPSWL